MKTKKLISILLTAALIISLAACSKGDNNTTAPSAGAEVITLADELGFGYVAEFAKIPYEFDYINNMLYHDGRVYLTVNVQDSETLMSSTKLISMLPDCSDLIEHVFPDFGDNTYIRNIAFDSEGSLWVDLYESIVSSSTASSAARAVGYVSTSTGSGGGVVVSEVAIANAMAPEPEPGEDDAAGEDGLDESLPEDDTDGGETAADGEDEYYESYEEIERLIKCDLDGNILAQINAKEVLAPDSDRFYINYMAFDVNDNIYLGMSSMGEATVYVLDKDMNVLFSLTDFGAMFISSMMPYGDTVLVQYYGDNGRVQAPVDLAAKAFGAQVTLSDTLSYGNILTGQDGQSYLYDDLYLYKYDQVTGKTEKLLSWIDSDINSNYTNNMIAVADDLFITNYQDYTLGTNEIMVIKQVHVNELPQRIKLTYGCVYLDYNLRNLIISFNRTNDTYRITIKDYSEYSTDDDYMAGYTRLNNDLLAGVIPDLISLSNLNINSFTGKDLLEDLYPYIDNDPALSRDYFVDGFLGAVEDGDGKLYQIGSSFYLATLVGLTSIVGESSVWTIEEMMAAYKTMPESAQLMNWMTKSSFLSTFLQAALADYVNYETGECSFNSQQFISLLEMANSFPTDYDSYYNEDEEYENDGILLQNQKIMLGNIYLNGFSQLDFYNAFYGALDITYKGFPTSTGSGHKMYLESPIAISSASAYKEGAWDFVKLMIGDDYQTSDQIWNFPVQKVAFDVSAQEAMEPDYYLDENGEKVVYENTWHINGVEYIIPPASQEDIDRVIDMISSIDNIASYQTDEMMTSIINEEVEAYFNGSKSAQDVANLIQNRVSTYIMENM